MRPPRARTPSRSKRAHSGARLALVVVAVSLLSSTLYLAVSPEPTSPTRLAGIAACVATPVVAVLLVRRADVTRWLLFAVLTVGMLVVLVPELAPAGPHAGHTDGVAGYLSAHLGPDAWNVPHLAALVLAVQIGMAEVGAYRAFTSGRRPRAERPSGT